ncbi:MAG: response regulator transcription factor [Thermodesulfobacteriota bacterium]
MSTTLLLVDDHQMMREGLRLLLQSQEGVEVVAEAENGHEALKLARRHAPEVVVMDVDMPDLNGIEATRRLIQEMPRTKVIGLSMHSDRQFVLGMLKAGASAYLLKDCAFSELIEAIRTVSRDGTYLPQQIADILVEEFHRPSHGENRTTSQLTSREREILQLIAEAKTSKEIAAQLNLSVKTVFAHRRNIMEKLKAKNLAELTRIAIRDGLTSLDG